MGHGTGHVVYKISKEEEDLRRSSKVRSNHDTQKVPQRKALDIIEDEVGRPINYHSYVSGVAGPDVAVMFAEEGINGAHQDPQYNVLYRDINCVRSFVDACESKKVFSKGPILRPGAGFLQVQPFLLGSYLSRSFKMFLTSNFSLCFKTISAIFI